jgi:hypothetical protein
MNLRVLLHCGFQVAYLGIVCGKSEDDTIEKVLAATISNKLAMEYNWNGIKGKRPHKSTNICDVVFGNDASFCCVEHSVIAFTYFSSAYFYSFLTQHMPCSFIIYYNIIKIILCAFIKYSLLYIILLSLFIYISIASCMGANYYLSFPNTSSLNCLYIVLCAEVQRFCLILQLRQWKWIS